MDAPEKKDAEKLPVEVVSDTAHELYLQACTLSALEGRTDYSLGLAAIARPPDVTLH